MKTKTKIEEKEYPIILNFLKAKFPIFHNSNIFYRDLQFGLIKYFDKKGEKLSYFDSAKLADSLSKNLEVKGIFVKINNFSWKLNYPEFVTAKTGDPF